MHNIIPVILCGGSGTRLWPLSRQKTPKQFLKLLDDYTLLQKTALRATKVLEFGEEDDRLVTITLDEMADETISQLRAISPNFTRHVLQEPEAKNTAAAVAYAIRYVNEMFGPDAYIWILPADHYVGDERALKDAVVKAQEAADEGFIVTFGITPTRPETGYGYIQKAGALNGSGAHYVESFHEKPDAAVAEQFVASGKYLWNSGMNLFKIRTGIESFEQHARPLWESIGKATMRPNCFARPDRNFYCLLESEPFDTVVLEKTDRVAVIPCDPQWSDIGSWESLWEIKNKDGNGNAFNGNVYCEDTRNSMVLAQDRLVTCVGVQDLIVIETGDSVLVANKRSGSSLKNLVNVLREQKRRETILHAAREHNWGSCRTVFESRRATIRECVIRRNQTYKNTAKVGLSQWVIAEGQAVFLVNGHARNAGKDEIIPMHSSMAYEIANTGQKELRLYEIRFNENTENREIFFPFTAEDFSRPYMAKSVGT